MGGNHNVLPAFGERRLDELTQEDIQRFKGQRVHLANKTVNHHITLMSSMYKAVVEWGVIERIPVELKQLKVIKTTMDFYDFDEFDAVVRGAAKVDHRVRPPSASPRTRRAGALRRRDHHHRGRAHPEFHRSVAACGTPSALTWSCSSSRRRASPPACTAVETSRRRVFRADQSSVNSTA